jgi:threonine aldolase
MHQMRKSEVTKDSFYEELEQVHLNVSKYHMKILLRDFNAKLGREIFSNRQANMQWLQNPNQSIVDNLNNTCIRREAIRNFRNKKKEFL